MKKSDALKFRLYKTAPLFMAALFFVLGAAAAIKTFRYPGGAFFFGPVIPTYAIEVILYTLLFLAALLYGFKKRAAPAVLAFIAVLGFFAAQVKIECGYEKDGIAPHERITGRVAEIEENGENSTALILDEVSIYDAEAKGRTLGGRVKLILYGQGMSSLENELAGSTVGADAELMYPPDAADYGFMSKRLDLLSQNVFYEAICHYSALEVIQEKEAPAVYSLFFNMRKNLSGGLERHVGGDEAAFLKAIITGDKSSLDAGIKSNFNALGISHLLATSGLHIGIMLMFLGYIFKKTRTPVIFRAVISLGAVILFVLFAGIRASMVRAAFMWLLVMAASLLGRRVSLLNSLGAAMLIMTFINPLCVTDISFVLSCVSVAAIAVFSDSLSRVNKIKIGKKILSAAAVSAAVVTFSWPVIAYYFNSVPLLSPVFNIIFVPLAGVALFLGLLFAVLSGVGFFAPFLGAAAKALSFVIIKSADFLAAYSPALNLVSPPFAAIVLWLVGAAVLSGAIVSGRRKMVRIISASVLAAALLATVISQAQATVRSGIKAWSDGSVTFLYMEDGKENALILNDDSYAAGTVLKKDAETRLDTLIYSGNDCETLTLILADLDEFDIGTVYAAPDVAAPYNAEYGTNVAEMDTISFLGSEIDFLPFKAKSKTAKTHYAVHIASDEGEVVYLDPLSLREGAFEDLEFTDAVAVRWTKSRAENIGHLRFDNLYYSSQSISPYECLLRLEHEGAKTYNITRAVNLLSPGGER